MPAPQKADSGTQSVALERWQTSPPQHEAASLSAIYSALEDPVANGLSTKPWTPSNDAFRTYQKPSSLASITSSVASGRSASSSYSATSTMSKPSCVTKKRKMKVVNQEQTFKERIFKCTFCCDSFKHK